MENTTSDKHSHAKPHLQYLSKYLTKQAGEKSWQAVIFLVLAFVFQGVMGKPGDRGPKGERVCILLF